MSLKPLSIAILLGIFIIFVSSVNASNGANLNFEVEYYDEFCNCDSDCGDYSSCLTADADELIMNAASHPEDRIKEANEAGYNGVCVSVNLDGEIMIYGLSFECTSFFSDDSGDSQINTADGTGESNDEGTGENSTEDSDSENKTEEDNSSRVIKIDFEEDNNPDSETGNNKDENNDDVLEGLFSKNFGGNNMSALTATIIAGTFVVVGFFGLMAWVAYLLQKKSELKGK